MYVESKSVLDALCRVKRCFRHSIECLRHTPAFKKRKAGYGTRCYSVDRVLAAVLVGAHAGLGLLATLLFLVAVSADRAAGTPFGATDLQNRRPRREKLPAECL